MFFNRIVSNRILHMPFRHKRHALPDMVFYAPIVQHMDCSIQYTGYNKDFIACELTPMEPAPPLIKERINRPLDQIIDECYVTRERYIRLRRLVKKLYQCSL